MNPWRAAVLALCWPAVAGAAEHRVVIDGMAFSPWHCVAAHRPLGSIMRVRKLVYETMAQERARYNGYAITEPNTLDDLWDESSFAAPYNRSSARPSSRPRPGL